MKTIFTSILLLITILSFSQKNNYKKNYSINSEIEVTYKETNKNKLAEIIVDGTFIGFTDGVNLNTINPDKIDRIKIIKKKVDVKNYAGGIIIEMKPNYKLKLITIKDLINKHLYIENDNPIIFQLDNIIINQDYEKCKVDENYILKMELSKITTSNKNIEFNLIKIITKKKENIKKANEIMLRGL